MGNEPDYFAYQARKTKPADPPTVYAPPPRRTADDQIDVREHHASTTIVEQIREGLAKLLSRE